MKIYSLQLSNSVLPFRFLFFSFLLVVLLLTNACKSDPKDEPGPNGKMSLKAKIDGKEWEATEFLVSIEPASTDDEHLWIDAYDMTTNPTYHLSLNIYDYKKTGTSVIDHGQNERHQNCTFTMIDIKQATQISYSGPMTITLTKIEGTYYEGTFSGNLCENDCINSTTPPIQIEGTFAVDQGVQ